MDMNMFETYITAMVIHIEFFGEINDFNLYSCGGVVV